MGTCQQELSVIPPKVNVLYKSTKKEMSSKKMDSYTSYAINFFDAHRSSTSIL